MKLANVEMAVLCQHLGEYDNSYLASVVQEHRDTFVAVGLIDDTAIDHMRMLEETARGQILKGIRLSEETLIRTPALAYAAIDLGLIPLIDPANGIAEVIDIVREIARKRPERPVVINHLGCPNVTDGKMDRGFEILTLASEPNVVVQLSGRLECCSFPYSPLDELVVRIVRAFGASRVMWGSNFPVDGDKFAYLRDLELLQHDHLGFGSYDLEWIMGGSARRVWFES